MKTNLLRMEKQTSSSRLHKNVVFLHLSHHNKRPTTHDTVGKKNSQTQISIHTQYITTKTNKFKFHTGKMRISTQYFRSKFFKKKTKFQKCARKHCYDVRIH